MNKRDACKYLNASARSLARYAAQGKIGVTYLKGKRGNVAEYNDEDLERLKAELQQAITTRPALERLPATPASLAVSQSNIGNVSDLLSLIAVSLKESKRPPVAIESKPLLTLKECSALTGLSRDILRKAIQAGTLKGGIIGKGFKIKRTDFDSYIKKL